jgi:hypothetical protein
VSAFNEDQDERESRLPRWAQETIRNLRRERDDARKRAEEARLATRPADSDALLDYYDDIPIGLGRRPVYFQLPRGQLIYCRVEHGKLVVHGAAPGSGHLSVEPQSSNVINLVVRD